jgi:hypothetical protein
MSLPRLPDASINQSGEKCGLGPARLPTFSAHMVNFEQPGFPRRHILFEDQYGSRIAPTAGHASARARQADWRDRALK